MLNFNGAGEQKEFGGGNGPIPPKSIVKVRMSVREPSDKKRSSIHPMLTISSADNNNHYLDCEFEVVTGRFAGVKVWQNFIVSGSEKATAISMAFLRAVIEASRGIDPKDASPLATQARTLSDWRDFSGMEFPVMVGVKKPKVGDQYINNEIMRAITPDKAEYRQVMAGGEIVSDLPIPAIPDGGQQTQHGAPAWGSTTQASAQAPSQAPAWSGAPAPPPPQQSAPAGGKKPAWA